ncbi:MAG: metallophosphoesterase [Spirochaetales bacterium]|nr:metallophosphoesterase [Spirochaetales bacterium]
MKERLRLRWGIGRALPVILIMIVALTGCAQEQQEEWFDPDDVPEVEVSGYTLSLSDGAVVADVPYVRCVVMEGDEFTILNFADLQIGSSEVSGNAFSYRFLKTTTSSLVSKVKPDMITLTGDQTYGQRFALGRVCEHIESFGVPWAPVYGNHDCDQLSMSLAQQSEMYRSFEHCLYADGPGNLGLVQSRRSPAIGNYVVNIVKIDGDNFRVVRSLIFLNSGNYQNYDDSEHAGEQRYAGHNYAHLNRNQLNWYRQMAVSVQNYGGGSPVPSTIILHMPIFGYVQAVSAAMNIDADVYDIPAWLSRTQKISLEESYDSSYWKAGYEGSFGVMHEDICGPPYDDGVLDFIVETGTTDMVYCGHEHNNNFSITYRGVNLNYTMKTGVGCYCEEDMIGGTVITVASDGSATVRHVLDLP